MSAIRSFLLFSLVVGASLAFIQFKSYNAPVKAPKFATPREIVDEAIKTNKVMVFSKTYCPFCVKAKSAIKNLESNFGLFELDERKDGTELQAALLDLTGQRTVPNVFVNGKHVGGCDNTLAAIASGEFQKMMK